MLSPYHQLGTNNYVHTISRDLRDAGTLSTVCAVVSTGEWSSLSLAELLRWLWLG